MIDPLKVEIHINGEKFYLTKRSLLDLSFLNNEELRTIVDTFKKLDQFEIKTE